MSRDESDPPDDELKPELEPEPVLPEETAFDVNETIEEASESGDVEQGAIEPVALEQASVDSEDAGQAASESETQGVQAVPNPYDNFDNKKAVERFFEAYRAQRAAEREALGEQAELLPADAPLRRKDGYFYAEPRRLPPPTPFEELVFSYGKPRSPGPTPEVEERWLPPDFLPKSSQSAGAPVPPAEGEIKVTVEVRLTSEARERITEQAIAKAAQTHQSHTEIVARRLYELTREIRDREAARRTLYRR